MTVFLDAGTTVFAVAERLHRRPIALRVVTNSLAVAERLAGVRGVDVDLLGGRLLASQSVLLGEQAVRAAAFYDFDVALLGAEGFDAAGASNSTEDVVAMQRAVVACSKRHAICADADEGRRPRAGRAHADRRHRSPDHRREGRAGVRLPLPTRLRFMMKTYQHVTFAWDDAARPPSATRSIASSTARTCSAPTSGSPTPAAATRRRRSARRTRSPAARSTCSG